MVTWKTGFKWIPATCNIGTTQNQMPLLDVPACAQIRKWSNKTPVYQKPIYAGQYLHYDHHPHYVTVGVSKCLYDRARTICLDDRAMDEKFENVSRTGKKNGYPEERKREGTKNY